MKPLLFPFIIFSSFALLQSAGAQQSPEKLAQLLKRFPAADADKNGTLTQEEARAFRQTQGVGKKTTASLPTPTIEAGSYGPHPASVFDFWKADSEAPAPLLVFIHGGGFKAGTRKGLKPDFLAKARAEGFAVLTIDYPFLPEKPVQEILPGIARAVQHARHHAKEWNIDPERIATLGGSAGAGSSLWIAAHPDLADPKSEDPVSRESSRVQAAASINGQATYDLLKWESLVGPAPQGILRDSEEPLRFYHLASEEGLHSEKAKAARAKVDVHGLLNRETPPLFLFTAGNIPRDNPPNRGAYVHSPRHSEALAAKASELGVTHTLITGDSAKGKDGLIEAIGFLKQQLAFAD
ncbi:alpha/beta hydrolase [Luteolibacter luteus]|uniref:Alpha/beta hydrolase n=1 Tax=Luteolibacter luteus TaxID=2728835 RepID=A0A858RCK1_9BACT|nr:alpha/beta hydrolase [Luteolibacter luteus]QJE94452.1 alpha/beta hydrolase [Luteolibacter luteus]